MVALLGGCAPSEWRPHTIVLVTIDTLRADHLGCYGYPRPTSPFIDELAEQGVLFERGFAASSTTVPSHASLLTGLYPSQHGVRRNGHKLPKAAPLVTEVLADHGYETAAFVSTNGHFASSRLDRGFSHFDEPGQGASAKAARSAERTVAFAGDWLRARRSSAPLFLWVHVFDPHSPYRPEEPLRQSEDEALAAFLTREHRLGTDFFGGSEALMLQLITAYDGEIRAVDDALRKLHQTLGEFADPADTLWIITSDHGEGLGNHDWLLHGKKIYNEQIRVPLIFHAPGHLAPARVQTIAEHVDIYPTLLDLIGAAAPSEDGSRTGRSLRPELFGAPVSEVERFAFSERRSFTERSRERSEAAAGTRRPPGPITIESLTRAGIHDNYEPGESFSIQSRRFQLIWNTELGTELYDLEADPYQTVDLAGSRPQLEQELMQRLSSKLEVLRASALSGSPEPVDSRARRALEALGYIDR